jgi:long-subunit acyl-CoA synthetase (AMP-forming)
MHSLLAITTPFTMFSHYYTPFELAHAIRLSKATRIFVQPQFLPLATKAAKDAGFPDDRIHIFEGQVEGRRSFDDMIRQVRKDFVPRIAVRPAGKDTLAYLIFSSGTSGVPKGQCNVSAILCYSRGIFSCHDITLERILLIGPSRSRGEGNTQSPRSKHISCILSRFNAFVPPATDVVPNF